MAGKDSVITAARVRELFDYDKSTGHLTRRVRAGRCRAGERAGNVSKALGYRMVYVDGVNCYEHRVIWLWVTGEWPDDEIDHRDTDRANNCWLNLRDVPHAINQQNLRRALSNSTTGLLGVSRNGKRWKAEIGGVANTYIGTYDTPEEAHTAYVAAKRELHEGCTI